MRGRRISAHSCSPYLQSRPEGEEGIHKVTGCGVRTVHVDIEQHWTLADVLHYGTIMLKHTRYIRPTP